MRGVAKTEFVSQSDARIVFREEFGEGADVFLDMPFLPASIKVRVLPAYVHPDSLAALTEEFSSWIMWTKLFLTAFCSLKCRKIYVSWP